MNRIYQGRVGAVVVPKPGKTKTDPVEWVSLGFEPEEYAKVKDERIRLRQLASGNDQEAADARKRFAALNRDERCKWETALREQHMTFQDAVNYYFLALAAMAEGLRSVEEGARPREAKRLKVELQERKDARKKGKAKATDKEKKRDDEIEKQIEDQITRLRREEAVWQWRNQVRDTWEKVKRGAEQFAGPKARLSKLLGLSEGADSFEDACEAVLKLSKASPETRELRKKAVISLIEEANNRDLNQLCNEAISPLCASKGQCDYTPKTVVAVQESERVRQTKLIHGATEATLKDCVEQLEPGRFVTQLPTAFSTGAAARKEAVKQFKAVAAKNPALAELLEAFEKRLAELGDSLKVPNVGRRPSGLYPVALVLKLWPTLATWAAFKAQTTALTKSEVESVVSDPIAEVRINDLPAFPYFTNKCFYRDEQNTNQAVWKEFDVAAFLEAVKSPHRYFQDTLKRDEERARLEGRRDKMKGEGEDSAGGEDSDEDTYGFKDDHRIEAIEALVRESDLLGYLEEDDDEEDRQYPIHDNTLRGWSKLRQAWREAADRLKDSDPAELEKELDRIRLEQQGERPEEAGGGGLFKVLQRAKYHCIWRDPPKGNQADDPL